MKVRRFKKVVVREAFCWRSGHLREDSGLVKEFWAWNAVGGLGRYVVVCRGLTGNMKRGSPVILSIGRKR